MVKVMMTAADLGTHYWTDGELKHLVFEMGECENCGAKVENPNAVWILEPVEKLRFKVLFHGAFNFFPDSLIGWHAL